jgi:hypothetical protein
LNKFKCRISNFEELLFTPRLHKIGAFFTPREKPCTKIDSTPRILTLCRVVFGLVSVITLRVLVVAGCKLELRSLVLELESNNGFEVFIIGLAISELKRQMRIAQPQKGLGF